MTKDKYLTTVIKTTIILFKQTRCSISPVLPTTNSRILLVASLILHSKYYAGLFLPFSYLSALIYVHSFPNPMQVCDLLQIHLQSSQQLEFELSYHFHLPYFYSCFIAIYIRHLNIHKNQIVIASFCLIKQIGRAHV